jgi:CRP/FNR family transcriptional regulator
VIDRADVDRVTATLRSLVPIDEESVEDFMRHATLARFSSGRDLMAAGDRVEAVPLLITGSIRVFKISESGREITLYRFGPGECCVLSADSIMGNRLFPARAQVDEDVEVAFIPARVFNDWLARSPSWRALVFGAMSQRLLSLMDTLEDVAFQRMDARVAALLLERTGREAGVVRLTHQEIADELGSAREVISRVLEELRARQLLRLARGTVEVIDAGALAELSAR